VPQFGDVKVSQLGADLSACGFLGGMARLFARVTGFLPLTMVFFPGFLRAGPWLVSVFFPCAQFLSAWACA